MKTYWAFEPGTTLYLLIDDADKRYGAKGIVVRSKRLRPGMVQLETTGMGIKFIHVDRRLVELCKQKAEPIEKSTKRGILAKILSPILSVIITFSIVNPQTTSNLKSSR
jgi:hypothetical protein